MLLYLFATHLKGVLVLYTTTLCCTLNLFLAYCVVVLYVVVVVVVLYVVPRGTNKSSAQHFVVCNGLYARQ